MIITAHAIMRFQERVANIPEADIITLLNTKTVQAAISFGAPYVRLGSGHRLAIAEGAIITVLPADYKRGRLDPSNTRQRCNRSTVTEWD